MDPGDSKYWYAPFIVHPQQVWSEHDGNVSRRHLVHLLVFSQFGQELNQISVDWQQQQGRLVAKRCTTAYMDFMLPAFLCFAFLLLTNVFGIAGWRRWGGGVLTWSCCCWPGAASHRRWAAPAASCLDPECCRSTEEMLEMLFKGSGQRSEIANRLMEGEETLTWRPGSSRCRARTSSEAPAAPAGTTWGHLSRNRRRRTRGEQSEVWRRDGLLRN